MLFAPSQPKQAKTSKTVTKSRLFSDKGDRIALYISLKQDDPVRKMNVPIPLPVSVTGTDMQKYVLDQFPDSDGVYNFYVYIQTGPYDYQQVYKGDAFKFDIPQLSSSQSGLAVDHFLGNENTTDAIPDTGVQICDAKKQVTVNWSGLMKKLPNIYGHVVQIGTIVASLAGQQDAVRVDGKNTQKVAVVPCKTGFFRLLIHDLQNAWQGLSVACFDSPPTALALREGLVPRYVVPYIRWPPVKK